MSIINNYSTNIVSQTNVLPDPLNEKQKKIIGLLTDKITVSQEDVTLVGKENLEKVLANYKISDAILDKILVKSGKLTFPTALSDFVQLVTLLTTERLDVSIINTFKGVMLFQDGKRKEIAEELKALTAELKIYSVIQSGINNTLASVWQHYLTSGNLLDPKLYGYTTQTAFEKSPEFALLDKMKGSDGKVSVKAFLESDKKRSGAMSGIASIYSYDKDNNKLGNFSTSVSDRARPLNDQVSEKTTRLNDVSSRYNSAIEALNRFIQKYDSVMRDILGAI